MKKKYLLASVLLMGLFLLAACEKTEIICPGIYCPDNNQDNSKKNDVSKNVNLETSQELKKFSSEQDLIDFISKSQNSANIGYSLGASVGRMETMAMSDSAIAVKSSVSESASGGASDFSATNVQVEGIDEADFVKNDGKYIYVITQNKLVIVDAYPAENAEIVSTTKFEGNVRNMFVNEDQLVIFADGNEMSYGISNYDFMPRPIYKQLTHVYVYDISDRTNPEVEKDYNMKGYYYDSRMIGDQVYFIVNENVYYEGGPIMPLIKDGSSIIARPEVFYFDNPEYRYNFNTIASFSLSGNDELQAKTFMMGYSNTLFVSKDNIYIAYQKNLPYIYHRKQNEERFFEVIVPLLSDSMQSKVNDAKLETDSTKRWDKISSIIEETYNKMDDEEKNEFSEKMQKSIEEYEMKLQVEREKTVIHRISIADGKIEYGAKGEVPGHLLNQFSMDEYNGNLRVATTTQIWSRKSIMYNNVFVLSSDMGVIGKLEALAPDERIYSTRFIGERLYMVTFKNIDPLFVIDLSNPENPKVLGELKIPGFSNYLHPYDKNHIIGIGKDTEANEWGGVSTKGIKIALFDVSDVNRPKQVAKYEIGDSGTDSESLNDHKAFLFDAKKNLLVVPVSEVKGKLEYDSNLGYYRQRIWQGAYAFKLTPEDGFELIGKITHDDKEENRDWYWYNYEKAVRRSLFMDDVLYTISMQKIKANDLNKLDDELAVIKLPYETGRYYEPYPMIDVVASEPEIMVRTIQ